MYIAIYGTLSNSPSRPALHPSHSPHAVSAAPAPRARIDDHVGDAAVDVGRPRALNWNTLVSEGGAELAWSAVGGGEAAWNGPE